MTFQLSALAVLTLLNMVFCFIHWNKYKEYKALVGEVSSAAANKRYHFRLSFILLIGWLLPVMYLVYTVFTFLF